MKTTTAKLYYSDAGSGPVVSLNDVAKILGLRDGGVLSRLADPRYLCHVHKNGLFSTNDEPRKGLQVCAYDNGVLDISNRARAPKQALGTTAPARAAGIGSPRGPDPDSLANPGRFRSVAAHAAISASCSSPESV